MLRLVHAAALLTALLGAAPDLGCAASLTVAPTRVDLAGDDRTGAVTLRNNAAEPVMVQVQTFAWEHGPATADLTPTRELLAVPPVVELPAQGSQIIRVALRAPVSSEREHAYRLLITEVPRGAGGGTGVRFALRLSLPVFVTPLGAAPRPDWSVAGGGSGRQLVLRNAGNAHLQVRRIVLAGGSGPARTIDAATYVLAGQEQRWPLPADLGGTTLQLEAETSVGPISATVVASRG